MSAMDLFDQIAALRHEGRSFALATVVGRRAPVSAHLGDRAIIYADGRMDGFVGGACSHEIVRKQALEALEIRQPRLVSIRPEPGGERSDTDEHVTVAMTCASEGAIDVYVEPFLQPRRLLVVGRTPVARSLARMARAMEYDVVCAVDRSELRDIEDESATLGMAAVAVDGLADVVAAGAAQGLEQVAVVASQGHYDEEALEAILRAGAVEYIGLVASRRRAATVSRYLKERGIAGMEAVHNPAGLDLGAGTALEIALSILAEIVQTRSKPAAPAVAASEPASAVDPVCGMSVNVATARHTAEVDGTVYYFCCANCRSRFLQNPHPFLARP